MTIVALWLVVGCLLVTVDRTGAAVLAPLHEALSSVVAPKTFSVLLETIVASLITLNSIIFFVLIMAVQHESAGFTPVVLDQFLRRRANQAFFGLLVGQTTYCLLVLALVPVGRTALSGMVALASIAVTLVLLLGFVYSTVDQMRPSASVWMIQQMALRARAIQEPLLTRYRSAPRLFGVRSATVRTVHSGHITAVNAKPLIKAFDRASEPAEVEFRVALGDHVVPGSVIAEVRSDDDQTREWLSDLVRAAVTLGRMPDVDSDAGHAVDHLSNMAWSAAAGRDPEGARMAIRALHNLLIHWGARNLPDAEPLPEPVPIVYEDPVIAKLLDALTSVITAAGTSRQHQTCSHALDVLAQALHRLSEKYQQDTVDRLRRVLPTARDQVFTREMERAFDAVRHALDAIGHSSAGERVGEIQTQLDRDQRLDDPASVRSDGHTDRPGQISSW